MIDFKEEISKYRPILTVDEVETDISDEIKDVMDLLQYIHDRIPSEKSIGATQPDGPADSLS